jgi:hypothetical protein
MTLLKGDKGGVLFRAGGGADPNGYRWLLGRKFSELLCGSKHRPCSSLPPLTTNLGQTYLLTVIARGSTLIFYRDGAYITTVQSSIASSGKIGLMASDFTSPTDAIYNNVKLWKL